MLFQGKRKTKACETNQIKKLKVSDHKEMEVCNVVEREKEQQCNINRRQKSKSLGPSVRKVEEKDVCENARVRARRQSARFQHDESKPAEVLFPTNEESDDKMHVDVAFCVKKEAEDKSLPNKGIGENRRSSISRPSRVAAKKVQNYKEISLNLKMRRPG
ncbi:SHUGOSHIN 2-like isoform X1 [Bidens hawaiensis]|uniref:SHUGOSHIN 2-like isoform X1 n=1 Tax=Bidens hawaiensis TaxID=980011 RepID=UPI00404B84FD